MKALALAILSVASLLAFASTNEEPMMCPTQDGKQAVCPKYVLECHKVATAKLKYGAERDGAKLDESTVRVVDLDDRWYNPSKYMWFEGQHVYADGQRGRNVKLVQKSLMPESPCF